MTLNRHKALDARLRAAMRADPRITHALAYGSFTQGTADAFSDLEYWVYLAPGAAFDERAFLNEVAAPILHAALNPFGTLNVILPGLLRVELHAVPNTRLTEVQGWPGGRIFPERMLVKDVGGELAALLHVLSEKQFDPASDAQATLDNTLNWLAFGLNVLARGERLRALELLWWAQSGVLKLACLEAGQTEYWLTPTRLAERRLPPELLSRYARLTAGVDGLEDAYAAAVEWTLELATALGLSVNAVLAAELRDRATMAP